MGRHLHLEDHAGILQSSEDALCPGHAVRGLVRYLFGQGLIKSPIYKEPPPLPEVFEDCRDGLVRPPDPQPPSSMKNITHSDYY